MARWKGIVARSFTALEFQDYVDSLSFGAWRPILIVLHNTGSPRLDRWHSVTGEQRMLNLQHYYRDQQGWSAGPHLFIADDRIWVFTPLTLPGVHSPSWNGISWGVEVVGDYSLEKLNNAVKNNLVDALTTLHLSASLNPRTSLRLHKDDPRTNHDCPGANISKNDIINEVHSRIAHSLAGEHMPGIS